MTDDGVDEVHLADAARVVPEGRDLLRVRRPDDDGRVAARPAGVVGGVGEVLDAVGRELRLAAGRDVAHPEVVVAHERRARAVGREHVGASAAGSAAAGTRRRAARSPRRSPCTLPWPIAAPPPLGGVELNRRAVGRELELVERQRQRGVLRAGRRRQRRGQRVVIERRARACARAGSTRMNSAPPGIVLRYQKRSSGSQCRTHRRAEDERRACCSP